MIWIYTTLLLCRRILIETRYILGPVSKIILSKIVDVSQC